MGKKCGGAQVAWWLLVIGGLNWGILGLGYFIGRMWDWNVLHMIFGQWAWLEALIYLVVGVSAIMALWGCRCKACAVEAK